MTRPLWIYVPGLFWKFYANYPTMVKNMTLSRKDKDMKKQPCLDTIRVGDVYIDISVQAILRY